MVSGSDSHISGSPVEELRWLEYGQRLVTHHRNIAVGAGSTSVGETLLQRVAASRAPSTGFDHIDDHILLDAAAPRPPGPPGQDTADRRIFRGNRTRGREDEIRRAYWMERD